MKNLASILLILLSPLLLLSQELFPDPGKVFKDNFVPKIHITITQSDLDEILDPDNAFSEQHYSATFIFETLDDRDTLENVGIRLRGNTSQTSEKKSFKISFNTFEPGRKYKGLEKLNINGEHNDPSVIRAKLYWDLCAEWGIPGSRSNHVELFINGHYRGLYLNVEHIDEEFVQLRFGDQTGNLYKCLWPATLEYLGSNPDNYKFESSGRRVYELKTNQDEDDYSGLAEFIDILNNTPNDDLPCELEKVFEVQNYLKVITLDILTAHWDGPIFNKNNFYLYSNPQTGKIQYLSYDPDNTFGIQWFGEWTNRNIYTWSPSNEDRPIYEKIMQNDHYRAQYTYYMNELLEEYFTETDFFDAINNRRDLISNSIPDDPLYPLDYGFSYSDFLNSYDDGLSVSHVPFGLKEFISERRASALNQVETTDAAPIITAVNIQGGNAAQNIFISAKIEDESSINASINFTFAGQSNQVNLYDDGLHNDGEADDQIFGGTIPATNAAGNLEYYINATDAQSNNNRFPFCENLEFTLNTSNVQLYLNEFQASNASTVFDEAGEFDDWIEIYNGGSEAINLSGFYLSDNADNPTKWPFPAESLEAGGFLLVWADKDEDQGSMHTNFKLNSSGETIYLVNNFGNIIEQVTYSDQAEDDAIGRVPNGTGIMQSVIPTPAASNVPLVSNEEINLPDFELSPNPFTNTIQIKSNENIQSLRLFNLLGQELVFKKANNSEVQLVTGNLIPGIYILNIDFGNGTVASRKVVKE